MKLGIMMFTTEYTIRPDELARACEERGFDSVWFPEHTHIPVSRISPYPSGAPLPKEYSHTYDLIVALMAAAAATTKINLGSAICLVTERDPIILAKEVASVDRLSNGRLTLGIGAGWNADECENHGVPFKKRWKVMWERLEAMKAIWTKDEAEYHGEFVNFDPIWCYPKPVQKPHPPVIFGTNTEKGLDRVAQYCDGWISNPRGVGQLPEMVRYLRTAAEKFGRRPDDISLTCLGAAGDEAAIKERGFPTLDTSAVMKCRDLGFKQAIFMIPSEASEKTLPVLDEFAALIPKVA